MLISSDLLQAAGTGTQEDPYSGSISVYIWDLPEEIWIKQGTDVRIAYATPGPILNDYECDPELGFEKDGGLLEDRAFVGVVETVGSYGIYEMDAVVVDPSGMPDRTLVLTIHVVCDYEELEFLSDPVADGVVSYQNEPAAPAQSGIRSETHNNKHVGGTD